MSPLVTDRKELNKKYTEEDFNSILNGNRSIVIHLWIKALVNSLHVSENELIPLLVNYANQKLEEKELLPFSSYHALFFTLYEWCVLHEWNMHIRDLERKQGTVTEEDKVALDISMMRFYRDFVVIRDNYQCQLCGEPVTLKTAHVHHIWQRHNSQGQIIGPSTLFNLITLCRNCHEKLHPWMTCNEMI